MAGMATEHEHHGIQRIVDKVRGMGVGTEDPNIIGDAGPTDVPPGADPPRPPAEDVAEGEPAG